MEMTQRKRNQLCSELNSRGLCHNLLSFRRRNSQKSGMAIFNGENLQVLNPKPRELAFQSIPPVCRQAGDTTKGCSGKTLLGKPYLLHIFGLLFT